MIIKIWMGAGIFLGFIGVGMIGSYDAMTEVNANNIASIFIALVNIIVAAILIPYSIKEDKQ